MFYPVPWELSFQSSRNNFISFKLVLFKSMFNETWKKCWFKNHAQWLINRPVEIGNTAIIINVLGFFILFLKPKQAVKLQSSNYLGCSLSVFKYRLEKCPEGLHMSVFQGIWQGTGWQCLTPTPREQSAPPRSVPLPDSKRHGSILTPVFCNQLVSILPILPAYSRVALRPRLTVMSLVWPTAFLSTLTCKAVFFSVYRKTAITLEDLCKEGEFIW